MVSTMEKQRQKLNRSSILDRMWKSLLKEMTHKLNLKRWEKESATQKNKENNIPGRGNDTHKVPEADIHVNPLQTERPHQCCDRMSTGRVGSEPWPDIKGLKGRSREVWESGLWSTCKEGTWGNLSKGMTRSSNPLNPRLPQRQSRRRTKISGSIWNFLCTETKNINGE